MKLIEVEAVSSLLILLFAIISGQGNNENFREFFVHGGRDAESGEANYQVGLLIIPNGGPANRIVACGGVLIDTRKVLTTAECVFNQR